MAADCQLVSDRGLPQLRSANSMTCVVRRPYSSYENRYFAPAGLWKKLAVHLRQTGISFW